MILHFKNKEGYRKWLAYGHIHNAFSVPGHQRVNYPRINPWA